MKCVIIRKDFNFLLKTTYWLEILNLIVNRKNSTITVKNYVNRNSVTPPPPKKKKSCLDSVSCSLQEADETTDKLYAVLSVYCLQTSC
jgi:hypothetical protein